MAAVHNPRGRTGRSDRLGAAVVGDCTMKTIDIVLPVYNEEEGLDTFHGALASVMDALADRYVFRVCYVLDRSRDSSFAVLSRIAAGDPRVRVLHLARRFGHQMS